MSISEREEHHTENVPIPDNKVGSFVGFVLLSEPNWDKQRFVEDFKKEWGIVISEDEEAENPEDENKLLYAVVQGMRVMVGFIDAPVPNGEAEYWAKANFMWRDGEEIVKKHKAQLVVSIIWGDCLDIIEEAKLFVKLTVTALKQENALALYSEGAVYSPEMYCDFAEPMKYGEIPILNLVCLGIYGDENQIGAYTYGMRRFGKEEMETYVPRDQNTDLNDMRGFLADVANYVLSEDVTLNDGETIGFSPEQRLPITLSAGIAVDGNTLKIAYGE